ncbi:hypothetical protein SAG0108_00860 [Streptococcus agalactiae BSU92]|uniref:Uncharacterized protein n=1 Tax=Streptococcus agalactiae CCUG 29376 TaxID=1105255 RepID=A0AAV3JPE5_STRAG|nr:hypothetical protein SAK_1114 [Streptococcus agalactiae A909]EAO74404.1 conserved hypothetical protein [Streptococcus agalactiae CJB111]EPT54737.1 hypothetical protein SAG0053_00595 [Streptococcus agalactiae CCUG 25532]EPT85324.1 hypothetical protein SAG0099_01940 [Streptococcus agalactiae BSU247]EPT88906.1 hypothetical protein SAG0104_00740 [Streptococcus agalactiae BSU178]EPT95931.1 hypothetical protein SAG0108_00860 [Streptococcus agalactiae BSU92]EPU07073.1 hypothetical protein SAG0125
MGATKGGALISGLPGMIIGGAIGFVGRVAGSIAFDAIEIIKRKLLIP